ncbi:hypothetical protein [Shewanella sp. Isolate11]|uniref:hypothetical protein n=1 Tax=Shewanella sp. Isolate11 TaxID=2908530 RepID=UPI001EFCE27E|nr:hypothetical protein [Shewanella sp. Isolate11]MCG9696849.1 hypothetical protein [Shewanella sp. Isolate11]
MNKKLLALLISASLFGCGGSDDKDEEVVDPIVVNPTPEVTYETGVFIDSAVAGIGYRTTTPDGEIRDEGVTNENGEYDYVEGDSVTFFIGDLEFPSTTATGVVTPLDIAGTDNVTDQKVVNMVRLLQTLDQDGDPENGITITETAISAAEPVDFNVTPDEFAASTAVQAVIENGGQDTAVTELVSESDAVEHLTGSIADNGVQIGVVGAWDQAEVNTGEHQNDLLTIVFFNNGTYVQFEGDIEAAPGDDEYAGMEWGTYIRDSETGQISPTQIFDGNDDRGFTDFTGESGAPELFGEVNDGVLTLNVDETGNGEIDGNVTFNSLPSDGIIGAWKIIDDNGESDADDLVMLIFYNDGTYVHGEYDADDNAEEHGMEWGNYTIDSDTRRLTTTQIADNNSDTGLSDFSADSTDAELYVSVDGDILTLEVKESGSTEIETVTLARQ